MIKNVIFDFGKVLVDYDFDAALDKYTDDKVMLEKFKKEVCSLDFEQICDLGLQPLSELYDGVRKAHPEWKHLVDQFETRFQEIIIGEMPGMTKVLEELKGRGFRLFGLTNWFTEVYPTIERYPIFNMIEDKIISCEEHLIKPDVAIYERLCEKFGVRADECLFTDDRLANIQGAKEAGMHAILFHNAEQFKSDFESYLRGYLD